MRFIIFIFILALSMTNCEYWVMAAEQNADIHEKSTIKEDEEKKDKQEEKHNANEFECKYYTVKLPEGWMAVLPPTDHISTVNAIFATTMGSSIVTMIIGPSGGADAQTIAEMFAEQFKSTKPPVLKNGQYIFYFPLQNTNAQAIISTLGDEFMVTTIAGNMREAKDFLKDAVKSDKWKALFPK